MLLNNQWITEEIKEEIKKYLESELMRMIIIFVTFCLNKQTTTTKNLETNDNENKMVQNLWDTAKAVLRGNYIAIKS